MHEVIYVYASIHAVSSIDYSIPIGPTMVLVLLLCRDAKYNLLLPD
jgi:hypothetical protein